MHETLIQASKDIDNVKGEEEEAFKKFIEFKTKFNEINDKLKTRLREVKELNERMQDDHHNHRKQADRKKKEKLAEKKLSVEEKMKKGMKLTTEDLLAFQGANSD